MKFCDSHISAGGGWVGPTWTNGNSLCFNCGNVYLYHAIADYSCGTPSKYSDRDQISILLRFEHLFFSNHREPTII